MELSDEQFHRYARHLILDEVGEDGQEKLLASRVLVVGAGGLGAPLLMYLAAAGVGTLGIVDDDSRQVGRVDVLGFDFIGLRNHSNSAGRGMNTALRFGRRHTLHAVRA